MNTRPDSPTPSSSSPVKIKGKAKTKAKHRPPQLEVDPFVAELDALRARVMSHLGEQDARYIYRIVRTQRLAELSGRALLFAGALPPAFVAGVACLTLSKVLENMEIGHNVLHGQYDWMRDPGLQSHTYEWDWACPAESWRHAHNLKHHLYTNIVGKDRDLGYALLRMAEAQPWHPLNLMQATYAFWQMLLFEWAVAVHDLEGDALLRREKSLSQGFQELMGLFKKATPQIFKDFVLFPLLAGPFSPIVFAGNLSANLLRNIWAFSVIYCGHFPDGVRMYSDVEPERETRAQWYRRQISGSANVEGPPWFHILSGHLSHQIEHHLFPDMPAPRYREIAPEVRRICERYGVPYQTGPFHKQLTGALRRILRMSVPSAAAT